MIYLEITDCSDSQLIFTIETNFENNYSINENTSIQQLKIQLIFTIETNFEKQLFNKRKYIN